MDSSKKPRNKRAERKAGLLGIGLDGEDGHTRLTTGPNFLLVGGSEETHEVMQEKAVKFNEHLDRRGKRMEEASVEELREIAREIDLVDPAE